MEHDPGLTPDPWVSIELRGDEVVVDGVPVQRQSEAEDAFRAAVRRTAEHVAAPLGRSVGATVVAADGSRRHVAVHPDGQVDDLDRLVEAASAPPAPSLAHDGTDAALTAPTARRRGRAWAALLVVLALGAAGAVAIAQGWDRDQTAVDPSAAELEATPALADQRQPTVLEGARLEPKRLLVAEVRTKGPCRVAVLIASPARAGEVTVTLRSRDGTHRHRIVTVNHGVARTQFDLLPAGPTRWTIRAPGMAPLSGTVDVIALADAGAD